MHTMIRRTVLMAALLCAAAVWSQPARAQGAAEAERALQKAIQKEMVDGDLRTVPGESWSSRNHFLLQPELVSGRNEDALLRGGPGLPVVARGELPAQ